jgi:chemotaxis protein methyltransferase CheR
VTSSRHFPEVRLSPTGPEPITDAEFESFRALILKQAGIALGSHKKALLVARLSKRLRHLRLDSWGAYFGRVVESEEEQQRMLDCICTNETRFFREPRHFALLEEKVFPAWTAEAVAGGRPRHLRFWSAACSTGEEPYSLAMCALFHLPPQDGWRIEIVATDLSTTALDRGRSATWPIERARDIPEQYLRRFMLRGTGPQVASTRAAPEIRSLVQFHRANLNDQACSVSGSFDVIFVRNVLIYFDQAARRRAIERILLRLKPTGFLFLGHAESLSGMPFRVRCVSPNVYTPSFDGP